MQRVCPRRDGSRWWVAGGRVVPATVRRAQPFRSDVPGAAAQHTQSSVRSVPVGILSRKKSFSASSTYQLVWHKVWSMDGNSVRYPFSTRSGNFWPTSGNGLQRHVLAELRNRGKSAPRHRRHWETLLTIRRRIYWWWTRCFSVRDADWCVQRVSLHVVHFTLVCRGFSSMWMINSGLLGCTTTFFIFGFGTPASVIRVAATAFIRV